MAPSIADLNGHGSAVPVQSHFKPSGQENGMTNHSEIKNGDATWKPTVIRPSANDVNIREEPFGLRKKMRIAILGAGISGINFFKFAEERLQNVEIVCYEKNRDVGGTWLENRYPGCACDIPSVVYQFPWRPYHWTKYYSHSPEIWEYIKMVEQENNFVDKYVKLRHKIMQVAWRDDESKWRMIIQDLGTGKEFEDVVDIVIDGGGKSFPLTMHRGRRLLSRLMACTRQALTERTGILNRWKWPKIDGLNDFQGDLVHSANWNRNCDLKGKRVSLIGAGSSAVQILPNIYETVSRAFTFVRNRIWITAGFAQTFAGKDGSNFIYSDQQHQLFDQADDYLAYRKMIEDELNQRFSFIINGSQAQKDARAFSENEMRTLLKDQPDLLDKIMPTDFDVGCRRPTPGNGYLEALTGPKTTAYTEQLQKITKKGFIDPDGNEQEVDVIICATGFDTSYSPKYPLFVNGVDMNEKWKNRDKVPSYLSVAYAEVPNYFINGGAYCPSAHGSFFPIVSAYTDYELHIITKMQVENIKSVRPKVHATEHFLRHANTFLKRTAWTGPCSSWFKGGNIDGIPVSCPRHFCG